MMNRFVPILFVGVSLTSFAVGSETIKVGSRLEPLVDDFLIETTSGDASQVLHRPVPREVSLTMDEPWEGSDVAYATVFQDGDVYRMYYRSGNGVYTADGYKELHREVCCYAESQDGILWTKPNLGLFEFNGSKDNNIVWDGPGTHNFTPFKDANPECPKDSRYKALALASEGDNAGLFAYESSDGIHWTRASDKPVITKGAFDSQNLAFWDPVHNEYRAYIRDFRDGTTRDIRTATSNDFIRWSDPVFLNYSPSRVSELYTNQVIPYYRAPHVLVGFPTRYIDRGWTKAADALPQLERRRLRGAKSAREGTAITDGMFMTSRNRQEFHVWPESFIRPGLRNADSWFYGDNYQNWGLVETASEIVDAPNEISVYITEAVAQDHPARLRRFTLRIDGFVSIYAPLSGGEFVTKPIEFDGKEMRVNYSTSAAGSIRFELQDENGQPIPGYAIGDSPEMYGDSLDQPVIWQSGTDLSKLKGTVLRLRCVLKDADLYAIRFD